MSRAVPLFHFGTDVYSIAHYVITHKLYTDNYHFNVALEQIIINNLSLSYLWKRSNTPHTFTTTLWIEIVAYIDRSYQQTLSALNQQEDLNPQHAHEILTNNAHDHLKSNTLTCHHYYFYNFI